ncbi:LysR family transcriptional regulator [Veronia nyctiphanis]|uniref:LysR family transcriptional regulator n=1 Tax=Veronia nyctiphanis TaxID=1278244 RepID=A0A4Q0Z0F9_9GAMM|nr:LysR family transcriptional regulator [Veronia nyctiphanis]RXJ74891.1 LysR family transcriptional regulator [Veronia nyctiphanis]
MNNEGRDINWEWLRAFLAVAELGSLNKAAETLTVSQPTLSRQLNALEKHTDVLLFHRTTQGVSLTPEGEALLLSVMPMREAYDAFSRALQGSDELLEGDIRLSVNELMAHHYIADHLVAFRSEHPAVSVELVVSNQQTSISRREADVAIRMFRPEQLDFKCQRIGSIELGFYCHRSLIDDVQPIADAANPFKGVSLIGFDKDDALFAVLLSSGLA